MPSLITKIDNLWASARFQKYLPFSILLIACLLGYSNSFHNDFMLDDHVILFGEAIPLLEKTLETSRYKSDFIAADLGYAYFLNGDFSKALEYFNFALKDNPRYSLTYYYLGEFFSHFGDYTKAENYYKKAYQLYDKNPRYKEALEKMGKLLTINNV